MRSLMGILDKAASEFIKTSIILTVFVVKVFSHLLIMSTQKGSAEWYESLIARYKPEDGASTRQFTIHFL